MPFFSLNQDLLLELHYMNENVMLSSVNRWRGAELPGMKIQSAPAHPLELRALGIWKARGCRAENIFFTAIYYWGRSAKHLQYLAPLLNVYSHRVVGWAMNTPTPWAESFFAALERELLSRRRFRSQAESTRFIVARVA
jgi:hypothetical protein